MINIGKSIYLLVVLLLFFPLKTAYGNIKHSLALVHLQKIQQRNTPYNVKINDIDLKILKDVYPTGRLGAFFGKLLKDKNFGIKPGMNVLDYGTGTGYLAIEAAACGAKVIATDINPQAIKCAKINANNNLSENTIEFRIGDSFAPILENEKFHIILAGLPWENNIPKTPLERSVFDPDFAMRKALFLNAKKHLHPQGKIYMTYAKKIQEIEPIEQFIDGYKYEIIAEKIIHGEPHYIFAISLLHN